MPESLRERVFRLVLPMVRTPGQYTGHEKNAVVKDHTTLQCALCLAFPDTYTLGMSHYGLQVLYDLVNRDPRWACERVFSPFPDFEKELRRHDLPLYGLETFTPLANFDVVGFSLQYEVSYSNILTILDLGRIPLHSVDRMANDPLIIAGGPAAQNPEPLAPFIDVFVMGDGEEALPALLERWSDLKIQADLSREEKIARLAHDLEWVYAPRFYEPDYDTQGSLVGWQQRRSEVPDTVVSAIVRGDFDALPIPTRPVIPNVEVAHDRIAIEVMRGCPWQCRFCQSTVLRRPLRVRRVETVVQAALEAYANTGYDEVSILSLSSSDYPHFPELVRRLSEELGPKTVSISIPSLRVNEQFRTLPTLMPGARKGGLTLAPEVARDDMRDQVRKPIDNEHLFEGCREAFRQGWRRVKLYFLCGLPGERTVDLDGIVELSERIARLSKEVTGRFADVVASVSNFIPKPHTPYQWNAMRDRQYFEWAHAYLRRKVRLRCVRIKCHNIDRSLLEGVLTRGDRRIAPAIEEAWRRGARLDAWEEYFKPELWWSAFRDLGIDPEHYSQRQRSTDELLPWDRVQVKKGRAWLAKEHGRAMDQLESMQASLKAEA